MAYLRLATLHEAQALASTVIFQVRELLAECSHLTSVSTSMIFQNSVEAINWN